MSDELNHKYLTRKEAAEYLRCSPRTLDELAACGLIPYIKVNKSRNGKVLYRREDLDDFLNERLVQI